MLFCIIRTTAVDRNERQGMCGHIQRNHYPGHLPKIAWGWKQSETSISDCKDWIHVGKSIRLVDRNQRKWIESIKQKWNYTTRIMRHMSCRYFVAAALPQSTERTKNINLTASFSPLIQNHSCKSHNEQWIATWALQYRYIFENTHDLLTVVTPFNRNFKENNTIGYYFQFDHVVDQRKVKAIYRGPYVRESVCLAYNSKFYIGQRERGEKPRHIYAG